MNDANELKEYKERLSIALKTANICIFELDLKDQTYTFFENLESVFGVSSSLILNEVQPLKELDGSSFPIAASQVLAYPEDVHVVEDAIRKVYEGEPVSYEARMKVTQGSFIWCKIDLTPIIENGIPVRMVGVVSDISAAKEEAEKLLIQSKTDSFTGVYNKTGAIEAMNEKLKTDSNLDQALMVLDVDNFKTFNDTYGHYEGDVIIKAVANHIKEVLRDFDIIGRFGGDEFTALISDVPSKDWLAEKLTGIAQFNVGKHTISTSIGIALTSEYGTDLKELFLKADEALYEAKKTKGCLAFA